MKSVAVTTCPGDKIKLSKIDPDDTGGYNKEEALQRFSELREKIDQLQEILYAERRRSLLLIFQAMDTGGKDGAIKDLCAGLNPAGLEIRSFKAPSAEELDHDFLWRAHKATPGKGMIGLWNRSHYEDVLIVRVHKLVPKKVWKARYDQINRFEEILSENGTTIVKSCFTFRKTNRSAACKHGSIVLRNGGSLARTMWRSARIGAIIKRPTKMPLTTARPNVRPGMFCPRTTSGRGILPWRKPSCAPSKRWIRVIPSFRSILRRSKSSRTPGANQLCPFLR